MANEQRASSSSKSTTLLALVIAVAVLYWARVVFVPLALALLLAFLLAPLAIRLRHAGLGRVPASLVVVLVSFVLAGSLIFGMATQLADLTSSLPGYQQNVHHKLEALGSSSGGILKRISSALHAISSELGPPADESSQAPAGKQQPVPVEIHHAVLSPPDLIRSTLGSALKFLLMVAIVVVFVIFILIQREDLRDRLLRLAGERRIHITTQLIDDAGRRVSRYLLAQLVVNVGFGAVAGIGLWCIGIPNPLLWAVLAALLRYIPYLGIWIAAAMPALVAFAVEPGWVKVPAVFGLYFGVDLLLYNFVEPVLYGSSTGTSPLTILLAAVFWTWLWGPVGLLLSTPLTVCIVVIGRYVPSLYFLNVLLGDGHALTPATRFWQRMLAMDLAEAREVAREFLKDNPAELLFDQIIIPALTRIGEERHRGTLSEERYEFVIQSTRLLVEEPGTGGVDKPPGRVETNHSGQTAEGAEEGWREGGLRVACIPAGSDADELGALMLAQLLSQRQIEADVISPKIVSRNGLGMAAPPGSILACVVAVPPFGFERVREVCRQLKGDFKGRKLIAAILTEREAEELWGCRTSIAVQAVVPSLVGALKEILPEATAPAAESKLPAAQLR